MGTGDEKLAWDKGKETSFTLKDCSISSSALDSLKTGEICYESTTGGTYIGTTTGYKPIRISYADYPLSTAKTITKEQEQIETLIRAVTNLIQEVEELKKDNTYIYDKIESLEEENIVLRNDLEVMRKELTAAEEEILNLKNTKVDRADDEKPIFEFKF